MRKSRKHELGRAFEDEVARRTGARKIPMSGAGVEKEDLVDNNWLIQCKATEHRSFSVTLADWQALKFHALQRGLKPRMEIRISDQDFVLIDTKTFDEVDFTTKTYKDI